MVTGTDFFPKKAYQDYPVNPANAPVVYVTHLRGFRSPVRVRGPLAGCVPSVPKHLPFGTQQNHKDNRRFLWFLGAACQRACASKENPLGQLDCADESASRPRWASPS